MPLDLTNNLRRVPSFTTILVVSSLLRVALIVYSEWHDAHSVVKYTDVDYRVFSDAARFVLYPSAGNIAGGPLTGYFNVGSPYTRATYRYTPLLAVLLAPNEWLHPSFGKSLFALCDILAGVLMYNLLVYDTLPQVPLRSRALSPSQEKPSSSTNSEERPAQGDTDVRQYATFLVSLHLLSPLVFTISTRGSSEAVLSLFVLATLYYAIRGRWDAAAVLLGLSTHWKIYPFIYGAACLGVASGAVTGGGWAAYVRSVVNARTARFALVAGTTFLALGAAMYAIWGQPFLEESYLYHLHRLDHRHNFSPYFYMVYLTYPSATLVPEASTWKVLLRSPLTSFVPQMSLAIGTGLLFGRRKDDLVFAWFVQTFIFVVFNKVCTSQYFLWYTLFLPLLIPRLHMSPRRALISGVVWIGTQGIWLAEAYKLEFLGQNVFFGLWLRGLIYVVGNCWVLAGIMDAYARP